MKRHIIISLFALLLGVAAGAQNIIVTNEGDAIKAYNVELAGNSVFYQASEAADAPIQKISKADILIIKMQDGTKLDPNAAPQAAAQAAAPAPAPSTEGIVKISGDAAAKNAAMIADFNRVLTWEPDEKFLKKHQGKIGNGYAGIMWVEDDSQLHNGEVTISYQRLYQGGVSTAENGVSDYRSDLFFNPFVVVKVKNNTDRIIYLDLASCFVICGEDSSPFYSPEITSVTNTDTRASRSEYTDVKVSDDKLKSSDHTYVSGSTSTVTKVKEAQQYVTVAPKATLSLEAQPICKSTTGRSNQMYNNFGSLYLGREAFPFRNTPYGQIFDIDEADSPFHFGTCVTYSFNSDHSDAHTIRTEMYLKYVMCTSSTALFAYTIEGNFHNRYPFWVPFYVPNE